MERAHNFNAGPSAIPKAVLKQVQKELVNFQGTGMSVMELSHRSKEYEAVHHQAQQRLRNLMRISDDYDVLFLQGGASLQFSMIPMNLLESSQTAYYVLSGVWSEKALEEATKVGKTEVFASSEDSRYAFIPSLDNSQLPADAAYLHITSNNTIYGTQWQSYPTLTNSHLIADVSSDILSKPLDVNNFSLLYAGAQKNLGPAGVTVVILKKSLYSHIQTGLPSMLDYRIHSKNNSLYNTPPTLAIYILSLVLEWIEQEGGVEGIAARNREKASILYNAIDESNEFYQGHARKDSRSTMNITFTLPSEESTKKFLFEANERGLIGLAGHRLVGGCRASIYNAVPLEDCIVLAQFMKEFRNKY